MNPLTETVAKPPYIFGNFPRIEIVFECIQPQVSEHAPESTDPKYAKLLELKKLLDSGVLTKAEFDSEKAKILKQP